MKKVNLALNEYQIKTIKIDAILYYIYLIRLRQLTLDQYWNVVKFVGLNEQAKAKDLEKVYDIILKKTIKTIPIKEYEKYSVNQYLKYKNYQTSNYINQDIKITISNQNYTNGILEALRQQSENFKSIKYANYENILMVYKEELKKEI